MEAADFTSPAAKPNPSAPPPNPAALENAVALAHTMLMLSCGIMRELMKTSEGKGLLETAKTTTAGVRPGGRNL